MQRSSFLFKWLVWIPFNFKLYINEGQHLQIQHFYLHHTVSSQTWCLHLVSGRLSGTLVTYYTSICGNVNNRKTLRNKWQGIREKMIHPDKACTRTDEIKGKKKQMKESLRRTNTRQKDRQKCRGSTWLVGGGKGRGWWEEETKGGISLLLLGACDVFQPSVQPSLWARN